MKNGRYLLGVLALCALPAAAAAGPARLDGVRRTEPGRSRASSASAAAVDVNVDVVGRLTGAGGILYATALDVSNDTADATEVDFDAELIDQATLAPIAIQGSITNTGLAATGGLLAARSVAHFDDFLDALSRAGALTAQEESDGVLGSLLIVFAGFTRPGQGSAEARFFRTIGPEGGPLSGGTIGVSANGHEITSTEPSSLVGIARDTRGESETPRIYTNFFVCNEGYFDPAAGALAGQPVTIRLTGYSNATGLLTGSYTYPSALGVGETAVIGDLFSRLGANPAVDGDSILVFVDVVSGVSGISGLSAKIDDVTKDQSAAQLRPADF